MQPKIQTRFEISLLAALIAMLLTFSAHATVPGQVNYQGLLLDDLGDPVTGPVDLVFSLFSDPAGGSPLWTEDHDAVDVLDGVYEVELGSTTALTPALLAGAAVYLEIEVEGETLTPRQRLLAVPYALQAESAVQAESAESMGTLTAALATQIYQNFEFDGGAPPNDDPTEGIADVDGDGLANFVDADNDDDGIPDESEVAQGSDINLVTPRIFSADPTSVRSCTPLSVHVQGAGFEPGMSVVFGSQSPTPTNLTGTDFDVNVGPQGAGLVDITATNLNLESDTEMGVFDFFSVNPTIIGFDPAVVEEDAINAIQVQGTNFDPGITVTVGAETPTPTNVTPTSFDVTVFVPSEVNVTVTNICGEQAIAGLSSTPFRRAFVSSVTYDSNLGGLTGADAKCAALATAAGLPGTYLAWLSDGVDDPDSRFQKSLVPYVTTVNNTAIADDWADLTDGSLDFPLTHDENGANISDAVFTNVKTDGTTNDNTNHCNGWTAGGTLANFGRSIPISSQWTEYVTGVCGTSERIFCFQQ